MVYDVRLQRFKITKLELKTSVQFLYQYYPIPIYPIPIYPIPIYPIAIP